MTGSKQTPHLAGRVEARVFFRAVSALSNLNESAKKNIQKQKFLRLCALESKKLDHPAYKGSSFHMTPTCGFFVQTCSLTRVMCMECLLVSRVGYSVSTVNSTLATHSINAFLRTRPEVSLLIIDRQSYCDNHPPFMILIQIGVSVLLYPSPIRINLIEFELQIQLLNFYCLQPTSKIWHNLEMASDGTYPAGVEICRQSSFLLASTVPYHSLNFRFKLVTILGNTRRLYVQ